MLDSGGVTERKDTAPVASVPWPRCCCKAINLVLASRRDRTNSTSNSPLSNSAAIYCLAFNYRAYSYVVVISGISYLLSLRRGKLGCLEISGLELDSVVVLIFDDDKLISFCRVALMGRLILC